jgi:large subunit ribosomal protein L22
MPHLHDDTAIIAKASARFQRVSARKARMVAGLIRNKTVGEAEQILRFTHRPSCSMILSNLLKSAVANVDHSAHPNPEDLYVGELEVNVGPIMYRAVPRARGRMARIRKRFCHVSIKLVE